MNWKIKLALSLLASAIPNKAINADAITRALGNLETIRALLRNAAGADGILTVKELVLALIDELS